MTSKKKNIKSEPMVNKSITTYERAVIIGMWRQGAPFSEIACQMNLLPDEVYDIVTDYITKANGKP